ncbi:hypothetical protein PCAR4_290185 [Paraburkholderia caribensis]|nr:hypothetical protein PCAR4_290185 [Paraburkholderia caribensis]
MGEGSLSLGRQSLGVGARALAAGLILFDLARSGSKKINGCVCRSDDGLLVVVMKTR